MQTQTTNPSGNKAHIVFDVRKLVFTALLAANFFGADAVQYKGTADAELYLV